METASLTRQAEQAARQQMAAQKLHAAGEMQRIRMWALEQVRGISAANGMPVTQAYLVEQATSLADWAAHGTQPNEE